VLRNSLAIVAAGVILLPLAAGGPCLCGEQGPVVAFDLQDSSTPDLTVIDSVYTGSADTVYAFLAILDMPGDQVSGYRLGFELVSPDSGVTCHGFHRLPGWVAVSPGDRGLPSDVRLPGSRTPAVVGYWLLEVRKGTTAASELRLAPAPGGDDGGVTLWDGNGNPVRVSSVRPALIGHPLKLEGPALSRTTFTRTDCLGKPIPENRSTGYIPGRVIAKFMKGTVDLRGQVRSADLDAVVNPVTRELMSRFGMSSIERLCENAEPGGSVVLSPAGDVVKLLDMWDVYLLRFPQESDVWHIVDSLRVLPQCECAEPDFTRRVCGCPNDPYLQGPLVYHHSFAWTHVPEAYDMQFGDEAVRIGIIDTGVEYHHPDLGGCLGPGCKVAGGWDYTDDDSDPIPYCWECPDVDAYDVDHGTSVAAVAAALANNGIGSAGVAGGWAPLSKGCSLVAFRCDIDPQTLSLSETIEAIDDSYSLYGCQVLNASYGDSSYSEIERAAIFNAHSAGVVFVASRGNVDDGAEHYPSGYDHDWVLSVGACQQVAPGGGAPERAHIYGFICGYGNGLDVMAPGDWNSNYTAELRFVNWTLAYGSISETSSAAPQVAGIAGLLRSDDPFLSVDDVEGLICASCTDITHDYIGGDSLRGYDQWSGWGRVCADSCLRFLREPWCMCQYTAEGTTSAVVDTVMILRIIGQPSPSDPPFVGVFLAERYDLRRDIVYPPGYCAVRVWGCGYGASTGWSGANPNYQAGFCRVADGSRTLTGCQLQSFAYRLYYYRQGAGWFPFSWAPAPPPEIVFAYTFLGCPGQASVTEADHGTSESSASLRVTPNPASTTAVFNLSLSESGPVSIEIYSVDGSFVRWLQSGPLDAGRHGIVWDGKDSNGRMVAPGVYLYGLRSQRARLSGKVVWLQ